MNFLHTEIGSAKDNAKSPIHNWYKFTAGFSHKFVDEIIALEGLAAVKGARIFDPFAGCGTTLVSAQKLQVAAVGNEAQAFMHDIIRAKLNWNIQKTTLNQFLDNISSSVRRDFNRINIKTTAHPLLTTLYTDSNLRLIYLLKRSIEQIAAWKYRLFFNLALSQTLHKTSIHPIAIPYIVRSKVLCHNNDALSVFIEIANQMFADTETFKRLKKSSRIFHHDSRLPNENILDNCCHVCITSPPYLNNLDYGEISKVHTHFFGITDNWNDITQCVRKKLVTGSTTHYTEQSFDLEKYQSSNFALDNPDTINFLLDKSLEIKSVARGKGGKKSFDILMFLYFQDMYLVLKEIRRVLRNSGKAYLILGDSAPYGVHIPTTKILGDISLSLGFEKYRIHKIRSRGGKWQSLKHRHSLELTENVLVLE